ncbi:MAG: hypothetical protein ACLPV8_26850 [Steroidobacteraceae bacterium]
MVKETLTGWFDALTSVNDSPLFTGNSGAFAEYRVSAGRISLKIPS